jgi:acetyl esterase
MPLHPQVLAVMAQRDAVAGPPPHADAPLSERRAAFDATWREPGPDLADVRDAVAPGPNGDVPIRIYVPGTSGPYPAVVLYHGGGFVFGSIESYDGYARRLAAEADCVVANVDYRRAPEHKYPTAHDDAYAALLWVVELADELGVDSSRIAVGGDSVGANLATTMALRSRDRGGPRLVAQILMCPAIQPGFEPKTHDQELTPPTGGDWWWPQYLSNGSDAEDPHLVPLLADVTGLPPALVVTAEYDELRDEGEAYARRLEAAGVPTRCIRYDGMWHVFHMYPSHIDAARAAVGEQLALLATAFGRA